MSRERYEVEVTYLCEFTKTIRVLASDETEAKEKAEELVSSWHNTYEVTGAKAQ